MGRSIPNARRKSAHPGPYHLSSQKKVHHNRWSHGKRVFQANSATQHPDTGLLLVVPYWLWPTLAVVIWKMLICSSDDLSNTSFCLVWTIWTISGHKYNFKINQSPFGESTAQKDAPETNIQYALISKGLCEKIFLPNSPGDEAMGLEQSMLFVLFLNMAIFARSLLCCQLGESRL